MGYIISMAFAIVVSAIFYGVSKNLRSSEKHWQMVGKWTQAGAYILFGVWVLIHTLYATTYTIPAGHVGIVYQFGSIVGQIDEGLQFVVPWRSAKLANIQVQTHPFLKLAAFSSESQDVFVDATLNIRISPKTVQALYRDVGSNYFEVLVTPRVAQNFKDETVKYKSVDIAPNREKIRHTVSERLAKELASYSIEVKDLLLNNIDFNKGFKTAIENKQIATQNALEEEQKIRVFKYQADQKIETAKGDGQAALEKANKVAEANRKIAASITPELIQYNLVDKLGANIEVMILPSGQNFILGSDLLKKNRSQTKSE